jgi:NAD+ diphosphatase
MKQDHPFRHCPACGSHTLAFDGINRFSCSTCGFVFFHNTAAACGAILLFQDPDDGEDRILLLVRGNEPARGLLDFPGGFIDPGEAAETALAREIEEEIAAEVTDLRYFCSAPNQYAYRGVTYATCDLVFTGRLLERPRRIQESEIAGYRLLEPAEIELSRIAFPSLRGAMDRFLRVLAGDEV